MWAQGRMPGTDQREIDMTYLKFGGAAAALILVASLSAHAEDQGKALDEIANFAERVCQTAPVKGSSEQLELSGKANADLKGLIARIADLGISGAGSYRSDKSEGVLQKDLAPLLAQGAKCKESISDKLIDKLIVNAQTPPSAALHTEDKDGNKYVVNWQMDPACHNFVADATHRCKFTHTQMSFAGDNTPYDHWDLSVQAPGAVYAVECQTVASNEFNEIKGDTRGEIDGSWARCKGWINGGDGPVNVHAFYKQSW
jgi:hypothetical protein